MLLLSIALIPAVADAKRKVRRPPCPGGAFAVIGEPLIPGGAPAFEDVLQIGGGRVSILSGCSDVPVKPKATRRGTRVRGRWRSCLGLAGKVRLKAMIEPLTCGVITGTLRAKRFKRPFQAVLTQGGPPFTLPTLPPPEVAICGNGVVGGFELCDDGNTADCDGCSGDCGRIDGQCGDGVQECGEACDVVGCPAGQRCDGCRCIAQDDDPTLACSEASTCSNKHFCGSGDCRCIRSAEGEVRCGKIPSCDVPRCATSADCTALGEGYFCDTPNSGCCSDGEKPRCIAPCEAVLDPDNVLPALSLRVQRLFVEAAKMRQGRPADVDGDGVAELVTSDLGGGAFVASTDADGDGRPEYLQQRDAAGNESLIVDGDSDGAAEQQMAFGVGPPPVRVTTSDTNLDGVMDRRETSTYDPQAGTVRVVLEADPQGDGTFEPVSDTTEPIARDAGTETCDGTQGFPVAPSLGSGLRFGGPTGPDLSVPYNDDGSGGRCTKARAQRIVKAVECALDKGWKCLERTNDALSKRLFTTLSHETLYFGCGNPCAGKDATTTPGLRVPGFRDGRLNFNPSRLDGMTDQELCGVTLHEMLHWAGEGLGDTAEHNKGHDRTYSCGRYCGGCIARGPNPADDGKPAGPNADCARCAGTEAEKGRCGLKKQELDVFCPTYNLCHAGLAGNIQCQECRGLKQLFCDDTETSIAPEFRCCKTCPSGYFSNDKPCFGDGTTLASCGQKPPDCP